MAAAQRWINSMSNADKPLLNRPAPASAPAPPGSNRSPNGGLHQGPRGPLTTKQAPKDSTPFSPRCHPPIPQSFLHPHGCIDLLLFNQRLTSPHVCMCLYVITPSILMRNSVSTADCKKSSSTGSGSEKGGEEFSFSLTLPPERCWDPSPHDS